MLDSNHTHAHVSEELEAYWRFVTLNSYCVVFDTFVEIMPQGFFSNRPWDVGDNPMTAVKDFLDRNDNFVIDNEIDTKLQITVAKSGFLKRIKCKNFIIKVYFGWVPLPPPENHCSFYMGKSEPMGM